MNERLCNLNFGFHIYKMGEINTGPANLPNASLCAQRTVRPNNTKTAEYGAEKGLLQGHARRRGGGGVAHAPKNPKLPKGFQQSIFKGQVREGRGRLWQNSWCLNPLFLQLFMQVRSQCSCKPPTRQMLFPVLQLCISLGMEKCYTLKGHSLENELSCIFQARGNILEAKAIGIDTKVKVKDTALIWSQICSLQEGE